MSQVKIPTGATHKIINRGSKKLQYFLSVKVGKVWGLNGDVVANGEMWKNTQYVEVTFPGWTTEKLPPFKLENK